MRREDNYWTIGESNDILQHTQLVDSRNVWIPHFITTAIVYMYVYLRLAVPIFMQTCVYKKHMSIWKRMIIMAKLARMVCFHFTTFNREIVLMNDHFWPNSLIFAVSSPVSHWSNIEVIQFSFKNSNQNTLPTASHYISFLIFRCTRQPETPASYECEILYEAWSVGTRRTRTYVCVCLDKVVK